jgi:hypothetical protein
LQKKKPNVKNKNEKRIPKTRATTNQKKNASAATHSQRHGSYSSAAIFAHIAQALPVRHVSLQSAKPHVPHDFQPFFTFGHAVLQPRHATHLGHFSRPVVSHFVNARSAHCRCAHPAHPAVFAATTEQDDGTF